MFFGLFIVGTLWFWLLVLTVCITLMVAVEYNRPGQATLSVLGALFLLGTLGDFNFFKAIAHHPLVALEGTIAYVLAGMLWSIAKWWFHVRAARERFDEAKKSWFNLNAADFKSENNEFKRYAKEKLIPSVQKEKGRIVTWMVYWPWSAAWTIVNDPVKRTFTIVYNQIKSVFEIIVKRAFHNEF